MINRNKRILTYAVLCAVAGVGFVANVHAEEKLQNHQLPTVIVYGQRDSLPEEYNGGNIATGSSGNLLGEKDIMDNPFTTVVLTSKTIKDYGDPSQPISSVLINDPSVRTSSSTMYNDISIRGLNLNGYQMFLNGVPGLFAQNNLPVNFIDRIEVTSGPNISINATTPQQSAGGTINMMSKRAGNEDVTKMTQTFSGRSNWTQQLDIGRRFGENKNYGIRINA